MNLGLSGRIALVTGGGRGLGRACARALAREGADVAVAARTASELDETCAELRALGGRALALPVDLARADETAGLIERVQKGLGAPTLLVLDAAALYRPTKLHNLPEGESEALLSVDLHAAIALCRFALPGMLQQRHGRIVALGSVAARSGVAGGTLYATAKAALEGLCRGLAVDYSRHGITANVAAVSFADTERLRARVGGDPAARERLVRATATRKIPTPDEVGDVVAFLCSDRASAVTGAVVDVTAGGHLNNLW